MDSLQDKVSLDFIIDRLNKLEKRITNLEETLKLSSADGTAVINDNSDTQKYETSEEREERYESTIGQSWMSLIGTVVIVTGLCFFLSLSYDSLPSILHSVLGYFLTASIYGLSVLLRKSYSNISKYLTGGVFLLLYFSTLRLHFFGDVPVIQSLSLEIILLTLVVIINVLLSLRKNSVYLVSISLTLGFITALVNSNILILYLLLTIIASLSVYLKINYGWNNVTYYFMPMTYLTHLIWFLIYSANYWSPDETPSVLFNSIIVLVYSTIYFYDILKRKGPFPETISIGVYSLFNSGFALLLIFIVVNVINVENNAFNYFLAAALFILFAIVLWEKEQSKYSTFVFALMGYFALSLAIISLKIPNYLIWLSWQSLLVVATAVWFRSKFIIVANFFIYALMLFTYYLSSESVNIFAISFGVVALLSARILNWNKDRLELKTEQMRNIYLISAFFAIPYTLYFTMPENFISISWIVVAVVYYVLSLVLNNKKYRWMSIYSFLLTLFYVAILGFTSSDTTYKIISFLALGLVLIFISILYTKKNILIK